MKRILKIILLIFSLNTYGQNASPVTATINASCYKKGYLSYTLVLENTTSNPIKFSANVLNSTDESPYDDSYNLNLYGSGGKLYSLINAKGDTLNWFGFPQVPYKCKKNKHTYSEVNLEPNERRAFDLRLCLKKYEKYLKSATHVELSMDIIQNISEIKDELSPSFFSGIIKTNRINLKK